MWYYIIGEYSKNPNYKIVPTKFGDETIDVIYRKLRKPLSRADQNALPPEERDTFSFVADDVGSFEGFMAIKYRNKWMRAHREFEWPDTYNICRTTRNTQFCPETEQAFMTLLCRGTEWAASGTVTIEPPDRRGDRRLRRWPYYGD